MRSRREYILQFDMHKSEECRPSSMLHFTHLFECAVDDGTLYVLDRHRLLDNAEHARPLARGWADAPGKLWEVVGHGEPVERLAPLSLQKGPTQ